MPKSLSRRAVSTGLDGLCVSTDTEFIVNIMSSRNTSENWAQIDSLSSEKSDDVLVRNHNVVFNEAVGYDETELNDEPQPNTSTLQELDNPLLMELGQRDCTIHLTLRTYLIICTS